MTADHYTHGHHESVLRSHRWRTAENSAGFLLPELFAGARVLDVGCGPGTISADLARRVAPGIVAGIDIASEVIETAQSLHADQVGENLQFSVDNVYDLSFGDESFDVVYAHQVLQHLSDPVSALVEMRRVLVNGGVLGVRDADYGGFVWSPEDPRLEAWMDLYQRVTRANGAQANAGRHLAPGSTKPASVTRPWRRRIGPFTVPRNGRGGEGSGRTESDTAISPTRPSPTVSPTNTNSPRWQARSSSGRATRMVCSSFFTSRCSRDADATASPWGAAEGCDFTRKMTPENAS